MANRRKWFVIGTIRIHPVHIYGWLITLICISCSGAACFLLLNLNDRYEIVNDVAVYAVTIGAGLIALRVVAKKYS